MTLVEPQQSQSCCWMLDSRWPWLPSLAAFGIGQTWGRRSRRKRLNGAKGRKALLGGIVDPDQHDVVLDGQADEEANSVHLLLDTGQLVQDPRWPNPFSFTGYTKAGDLQVGSDLLRWVEVLHQIMTSLDVVNAVLPVWSSRNMAISDTTLTRISLDTPNATYNLGTPGTFELQRARTNYWRYDLGDKYIRHPRWGTYLRRAHLDRVGGLQRVRDAVPLAKVLELGGAGDLVYLQCTEHPEGALTPEGERVRQALEDVLAPIVAPPRPQELA